jgi:hypothetical protein
VARAAGWRIATEIEVGVRGWRIATFGAVAGILRARAVGAGGGEVLLLRERFAERRGKGLPFPEVPGADG